MTAHSLWPLVLVLLAGCVTAPCPDRASGPDAEAVSAVLDGLYSPDPARKALARSLLEDIGPAGASPLRGLLTSRTEPADPFIRELVASLDTRESLLANAARDQIVLRGRQAAADLWEAVLATESPVLALRALEILVPLEGPARVRSAVEALRTWGAAPKWLDPAPSVPRIPERLAAVREADREPTAARRCWKPTEAITMREYLAEIDEADAVVTSRITTWFAVEREKD